MPVQHLSDCCARWSSLHYISSDSHGAYFLGYKLFELGNAFSQNVSWRSIITPYIRKAAEETGMTLHVSILVNDTAVRNCRNIPGKISTMQLTGVGKPLAMHSSATAKVLLAWQPPEVQERILNSISYVKFSEKTITTKEALKAELARVRCVWLCGFARSGVRGELPRRCPAVVCL